MGEGDRYIPGVPCWVDTAQPDPGKAAEFYAGIFGWDLENVAPDDAPGPYLVARVGDGEAAAIMPQLGGGGPVEWTTYIWVESADETAEKVRHAGGTVTSGPVDAADSGRMADCADTEGATFRLWEPRLQRGATVVNQHGSVNFNDLHSRDPEKAKEFYGQVFGWGTLDLGGAEMWTLPGYGDFLESIYPGTRERMAGVGAPPGFEDVVASLLNEPDASPRWGVTFGVDDADEVAKRAADLGGEVVSPPADAPWVRTTTIRDPQGALFVANQFVPPDS